MKSLILLFKTPDFNFLAACCLYSCIEAGRGPLYIAIMETVLQKNESTTLLSLNPINLSAFKMLGGMVLGREGDGLATGRLVTSLTG